MTRELCDEEHEELILHSRCHPHAPVWVWYNDKHKTARVACAQCEKQIVELKIEAMR